MFRQILIVLFEQGSIHIFLFWYIFQDSSAREGSKTESGSGKTGGGDLMADLFAKLSQRRKVRHLVLLTLTLKFSLLNPLAVTYLKLKIE